jgi:hypothetical protein
MMSADTNRDNDIIRLFVRRTAVLPLVPPELVEDVWFNALEHREEIAINATTFTDYVGTSGRTAVRLTNSRMMSLSL